MCMVKLDLGRIDGSLKVSNGSTWRDPDLDLGPNFK
jgi:hypothetical protein